MTDRERKLQEDVLDELAFDPSLDAAHIGVSVKNGVATLSGHVASWAEKTAAERAAYRVKGIRAVAQEIDVRLPTEHRVADDDIAERVLHVLAWNVAVPEERIRVKVEHGVVTLTGDLDWQYQRKAVEDAVRKLQGVVAVVDGIALKSRVQTADVRHAIERAFERNAELEAKRIAVRVEDGTVVLEGTVHDQHEREMAEIAAWSSPGIVKVDDRLRIA